MPSSTTSFLLFLYSVLLLWGSLLLWKMRSVRQAVRIFVQVGIGLIVYFTCLKVLFLSPALYGVPHLIGTGAWFWYLIGPLFYLTIRVLVDDQCTLRGIDALHLFPLLGMLPGVLPFYALSGEQKLEAFASHLDTVSMLSLQSLFFELVLFAYMGFTWHAVQQSQVQRKERWQYGVVYGALLTMFAVIIGDAVASYSALLDVIKYHATVVFTLAAFFTAVYAALHLSKEETAAAEAVAIPPHEKQEIGTKYQHAPAEIAQLRILADDLAQLMQDEYLYRNANLQRRDLAEHLGISVHRLSQLFSQGLETSFYAYVNSFRIEESMRLLQDPNQAHLTLLAISMEVGFNSKSTFNRTFKKRTGVTPSIYRKSYHLPHPIQARSS